jgi:hypothetical protein
MRMEGGRASARPLFMCAGTERWNAPDLMMKEKRIHWAIDTLGKGQ